MTNNEWGFITLPTHADPEQRAIARLKLSSEMSLEHYKTPLLHPFRRKRQLRFDRACPARRDTV